MTVSPMTESTSAGHAAAKAGISTGMGRGSAIKITVDRRRLGITAGRRREPGPKLPRRSRSSRSAPRRFEPRAAGALQPAGLGLTTRVQHSRVAVAQDDESIS